MPLACWALARVATEGVCAGPAVTIPAVVGAGSALVRLQGPSQADLQSK